MIFRTPDIEPSEERVLELIRELWRVLRSGLRQQPRRWSGLLARNLRARAIQGSNCIEGYVVTREDALAAVDGEDPFEASDTDWQNVVHYRDAMNYILQLSTAADFSYSKDLLRSLHFMMMHHEIRANPGTWRPGAIFVRNDATGQIVYEGPGLTRYPPMLSTLLINFRLPMAMPPQ
ncbi:MAG: hypothetical protein R3C68_12800 [Myxococcota bacterium]